MSAALACCLRTLGTGPARQRQQRGAANTLTQPLARGDAPAPDIIARIRDRGAAAQGGFALAAQRRTLRLFSAVADQPGARGEHQNPAGGLTG